MRAKLVAPSEEPTKERAAEAASPASFQPLNAQTIAGARSPSGRLSQTSGCIRTKVHHADMAPPALRPVTAGPPGPVVATLRDGDAVDVVLACSRKERLVARSGSPYLALELRDRTGAI